MTLKHRSLQTVRYDPTNSCSLCLCVRERGTERQTRLLREYPIMGREVQAGRHDCSALHLSNFSLSLQSAMCVFHSAKYIYPGQTVLCCKYSFELEKQSTIKQLLRSDRVRCV